MKPERWQKVKEVLEQAVALDAGERPLYLDRVCAADVELRREVDSLLASHERAGAHFLEVSAVDLPEHNAANNSPASRAGRRVGVYQVAEEIGHGGMGEVYRATRADGQYDKEVALKLVRSGYDTAFVIERFRHERQILASLDHPNIARLLDGGTTEDGIPYLVMDLIVGDPIDLYCEARKLSIPQRLRIFRQVCAAVQYAHQRLVIHRDIKPGNILVTGEGTPKLLDFGIAKLLDAPASSETTLARPMTPEYASPEQIRGQPITTASDVYSLGIVLYQVLTRRSPYPENTRAPLDLARVICETEPGKPSSAILGGGSSAKLRRQLSGDLDNIVLKALRKEPERRYATVEQFSEDIRRHLQGMAVTAAPDQLSYRFSKFVRRHKTGVAAAGLIVVAILGGVMATLREARIAASNEQRAERRFNDVRQLANSLMFEVHDSIQDLPGATPARKLIVERALQYLDSLAGESRGDASLQRELATAYKRVGDVQGYPFRSNLGDISGAILSYQKALAIRERLVQSNPDNILDTVDLAGLCRRLAESHSMNQDITIAVAEGQRALQIGEKLVTAHPQSPEALQELIKDYQTLAGIEGGNFNSANLGDTTAALTLGTKATTIAEQLAGLKPDDPSIRRLLASTILALGDQLSLSGERQEALQQYRRGQEIIEALTNPKNATSMVDLAEVYFRVGNMELADGDFASAMQNYAKGLNLYKAVVEADPRETNARIGLELAYANVGDVESRMGHQAEALSALNTSRTISDEVVSASPTALARSNQGIVRVMTGEALARYGEDEAALRDYREALKIFGRLTIDDPRNLDSQLCSAATYDKVGAVLLRLGKPEEATAAFQAGLRLAQPQAAPEHLNAQALYVVADAYSGLGDVMSIAASDRKQSRAKQIDHWQSAQSFYQQSLETWSGVKEPGIVSPEGFDCVPPAMVTRQLERCQQALHRLGKLNRESSQATARAD